MDNLIEHRRKQGCHIHRGRMRTGIHVAVLYDQRRRIYTLATRKTLSRLGGIALGIKGDLGRRTLENFIFFFRSLGDFFGNNDKATRRREDLDGTMRNSGIIEEARNHSRELLYSTRKVESRNVFGTDFEGERTLFHQLLPLLLGAVRLWSLTYNMFEI